MSLPVNPSTSNRPPDKAAIEVSNPNVKRSEAYAKQAAGAQSELNASIVQASIDVSINSQNEPLALLLKSAIESLNETLKPDFGDNAIQNAVDQDNTPEGTAGRIVSLSTGFYDAFKKQHAGEDEADVLKKFMDTIGGGIERGFKEAREILKGLKVLDGAIGDNVDKTYSLVMQGLKDFEAAQGKPADDGKDPKA